MTGYGNGAIAPSEGFRHLSCCCQAADCGYNRLMDTTTHYVDLATARDVAQDIEFAQESGEFDGLGQMAPLLRYCAGLTYGTTTTRQAFIEAAEEAGYNPATAGVCWAAGRKFMKEMEAE